MSLTSEKTGGRPLTSADAPRGAGGRRREFTRRQALLIAFFLAPAAVFVAVFTYYPILSGAQMAFRNWNLNDLTNTDWIGVGNFATVFADPLFWTSLQNSVTWVVGSLIPQVTLGFALALMLRRRFAFRGVYQALAFFPWAVSGFLIGILFRWMFNGEFGVINDLLQKTNLIDTPIPWLAGPSTAMFAVIVANIWYGVTFFAIMILAALQSVPDELFESAALDGAGRVRTLINVTLPFIRTTLALTILLRVIWIFNFPDIIYGMTGGGPGGSTQIVTTYMIGLVEQGNYGTASAVGLFVILLLLIFATFYLMATRERKGPLG